MNLNMRNVVLAVALASTFSIANATALVTDVPSTIVDSVTVFFGGTLLDIAIPSNSNNSDNGFVRSDKYNSDLDFHYQFCSNASSKKMV